MSTWSSEDDAILHRKWVIEGLSAGVITGSFPGRTRNAIIGRVFRMGWSRPQASEPGATLPYPQRACATPGIARRTGRGNSHGSAEARAIGQRKTAPGGSLAVDTKPTNIASPNAKPWTERTFGQCAFPVDGDGADTRSCCNRCVGVYCADHAAIMSAPHQPRKLYVNSDDPTAPRSRPAKADTIFSPWLAA